MRENTNNIRHSVCLIGMFILGEALILAPYGGADSLNIFALIGVSAVSAILLHLLTPLISLVFCQEHSKNNPLYKALSTLCYSLAIIFSVFLALKCFVSAVDFVSGIMLRNIARFIISAVLAAVAVVLAFGSNGAIYKFSLILAIVASFIIVILFALSLPEFEIRNIVPYSFSLSGNLVSQIADYFFKAFMPAVIAVVYICITSGRPAAKLSSDGILFGAVLLIACVANSILIFGAESAADMQFSYVNAVSAVSVGELFTRMDGFSYPLLLVTAFVKITVCLKVALILVTRLGFKYKKCFLISCGALMLALSFI